MGSFQHHAVIKIPYSLDSPDSSGKESVVVSAQGGIFHC
jgi:hypothetical protein